jgi:hypothetical protein
MGMSVRCVDLENALAALVPIDSPGKRTTHKGGNCFALPAGDSLSSAVRSSGHRMTIGFPKDKPRHDSADAFRYMAAAYREIVTEAPKRPPPVLLTDLTLDEFWEMQPRRRW